MFYARELSNLNNPGEYRTALKIMHDSMVPENPIIDYLYHQEFGSKEEFEKAETWLSMIGAGIRKHQKSLKEKLESLPLSTNQITEHVNLFGFPVVITVGRERRLYRETPL
jgi:hypothetical protein